MSPLTLTSGTMKKAIFTLAVMSLPMLAAAQTSWNESTNWLGTYHRAMGAQASSTWMVENFTESDALFESTDGMSFAMVQTNEFMSSTEVIADLESAIVEGNRTQLMPEGTPEAIGYQTYRTQYRGTIAGLPVRAVRISSWNMDGAGQTVMMVFTDAMIDNPPVAEANEFALGLISVERMDSLTQK